MSSNAMTVHNALSLFASCIKSGEGWSPACQQAMAEARVSLNALGISDDHNPFRLWHTRDSLRPVVVNINQLGAAKPQRDLSNAPPTQFNHEREPGLDGKGGTAIWILGRQEPFYVSEGLEQLRLVGTP